MPDVIPFVIIPARGGSRGVPRKNLQRVGGCTLLERAIWTAASALRLKHVFVSTEDAEIAEHARRAGARVIDRPADLAADDVTSEAVMAHAIAEWLKNAGVIDACPTHIVLVQCTAPLLYPEDIERCIAAASDGVHDAAFTACRWHGKAWKDVGGMAMPLNHNHRVARQPRQYDHTQYLEAGSVYATSLQGFEQSGSRFGMAAAIVEIEAQRVFEIDDAWQLEMARRMVA